MSFHFYADDTQLYVSFKSFISGDLSRACSTLEACGQDIDKWMLCNKLTSFFFFFRLLYAIA